MEYSREQPYFMVSVTPQQLQKEKEKARVLRKTQWWQRQMAKGVCYYCQRPVTRDQMTLDHIVPLIRGGRSTRGNMVLACKTCNNRKKYLLPMEWEDYLQNSVEKANPELNPSDSLLDHED
jgi:5-methylcytosine-specific restriction protein A